MKANGKFKTLATFLAALAVLWSGTTGAEAFPWDSLAWEVLRVASTPHSTRTTAKKTSPARSSRIRVDGAAPGEWTQDWDAATAAAKETGIPVFVNFTGSDWCPWCEVLQRQVFSKSKWISWARRHVYLVHIDFPSDKELVPEKYRDRNKELSRRYGIEGYPTCLLLDPATLEPLGRFGASRDVTPASFIAKVSAAMPKSAGTAVPAGPSPSDIAVY